MTDFRATVDELAELEALAEAESAIAGSGHRSLEEWGRALVR